MFSHVPTPGTSEVRHQFLAPLQSAYDRTITRWQCPVESDWAGLLKGVERVLSVGRSGRDFLQIFGLSWPQPMAVGTYFETLDSRRRLVMVVECAQHLRQQVELARSSPLSAYAQLDDFEVYAGDSHYLEAATHDVTHAGTAWPTGHFFALNLKSQSLFPLTLADQTERKMEQDARALKRQSVAQLRQGAGKGRKVLWVWDKAAVDLAFWQERKNAGIYFLSRRKSNLCLDWEIGRAHV